jgi:DNA-binding transcriptional MerR regulator
MYEASNILMPAGRTKSGYRLYDEESFVVLTFVKQAQSLGFRPERDQRHRLASALRPEPVSTRQGTRSPEACRCRGDAQRLAGAAAIVAW